MTHRILILDDDDDLLEILSLLLGDNGYEVLTLTSGEKIFETIGQFNPDLILMDIMLAGIDGRVICNKIKRTPGLLDLPIILISSNHNLVDLTRKEGAPDDYLVKPFDMPFLLNTIKKHLAASSHNVLNKGIKPIKQGIN